MPGNARSRARLSPTGPRAQDPAHSVTPSPVLGVGPVRTCVGCRERDLRSVLLRLAVAPDARTGTPRIVADTRGVLPGRGAWIHPTLTCLDLAVRRRAVPRALRVAASLDLALVRDHVEGIDR